MDIVAEDERIDSVGGIADDELPERAEPAARLWARLFDTWLNVIMVAFLLGMLFPTFFAQPAVSGSAGNILSGMIVLPFALLVDALMQGLFGNTPGKRLAGIRLERGDGARVTVALALRRNADVYLRGLCLGVPFLNLIGMSRARDRLLNEGATSWDEPLGTWVVERGSNELRTIAVALLALTINFGALAVGKYAEYKQPHWDRQTIVAALPELNRGLPMFLDDITRLDQIAYDPGEDVMSYEYTLIHRDASTVYKSELADPRQMRTMLLGDYCGENLRFYRERDIPARYRYSDAGGIVFEFMFTPPDCRPAR